MGVLTQILGLILSLSVLIFVHELGHYLFARLFKTRVDKFYLFFNPGFSVMRAKKFKGKWHFSFFSGAAPEEWNEHPEYTEWGIGWLPLGGYCSINGMIDETTSAGELPEEPQPYEFRSKPAWQRFFIIFGGVLVNFITALILYPLILFSWGKEYIPLANATYGLQFSDVAKEAGFRDGDKIISLDGDSIKLLSDLKNRVLLDGTKTVIVDRNGEKVSIQLPDDFPVQILGSKQDFCDFNTPLVIDSVLRNGSVLSKSDSLVALNGVPLNSFSELQNMLKEHKGKSIAMDFYRNGERLQKEVQIDGDAKLGISFKSPVNFLKVEKKEYTLWQSIPEGIANAVKTLGMYVKQFKLLATKEGASQLGGFITIGSIFPKTWDWQHFWSMTAFLSIILAFMNILPIPGLDGGYILFILVEMITGRKPSDKFLTIANTIGFVFLIILLLYANGMDFVRLFTKWFG